MPCHHTGQDTFLPPLGHLPPPWPKSLRLWRHRKLRHFLLDLVNTEAPSNSLPGEAATHRNDRLSTSHGLLITQGSHPNHSGPLSRDLFSLKSSLAFAMTISHISPAIRALFDAGGQHEIQGTKSWLCHCAILMCLQLNFARVRRAGGDGQVR